MIVIDKRFFTNSAEERMYMGREMDRVAWVMIRESSPDGFVDQMQSLDWLTEQTRLTPFQCLRALVQLASVGTVACRNGRWWFHPNRYYDRKAIVGFVPLWLQAD